MRRERLVVGLVCVLIAVAALFIEVQVPQNAAEELPDFDIPGGHFYRQANGTGGAGNDGFAIVDDQQALFWTEFSRLGAVPSLGYPSSQRFIWDGFVVQAMQRVVLQWWPNERRAAFVNVFDMLHKAGKDDWLAANYQIPPMADWSADKNKSWEQVVATHLALLEGNEALKAKYLSVAGDPVQMNGLPMAPIFDNGSVAVLRCQRVAITEWKVDAPGVRKGDVVVVLGGDMAKEAGLVPGWAATPVPAPAPSTEPTGSSTATAGRTATSTPSGGAARAGATVTPSPVAGSPTRTPASTSAASTPTRTPVSTATPIVPTPTSTSVLRIQPIPSKTPTPAVTVIARATGTSTPKGTVIVGRQAASVVQSCGTSMLVNGSFETSTGTLPHGWTAAGPNGGVRVSENASPDGARSVVMSPSGAGEPLALESSNGLSLRPGKRYAITMMVKASQPFVGWQDGILTLGVQIGSKTSGESTISVGTEWQRVSTTIAIPNTGSGSLARVKVHLLPNPGVTTSIFIDSIEFCEAQ